MEHGYGEYITDRLLHGKACVTLVFELDYEVTPIVVSEKC